MVNWCDVINFWVSDCCLMPIQQFFSYIMARTSWFSMRWWWGLLCTRPTVLAGFLSFYLLFLLNAACLAEKQQYQFYSLWFNPIRTRTHDLPQSRRAHTITPPMWFKWLLMVLMRWQIICRGQTRYIESNTGESTR